MTPEQKHRATVKFAEAMGWKKDYIADTERAISLWVPPGDKDGYWRDWNPWDNPADAIELAENLNIQFHRDEDEFIRNVETDEILIYSAYHPTHHYEGGWSHADNLCEAIWLAVIALLEERC